MSKGKEHYEVGSFGLAACGKRNVTVTKHVSEVTCRACIRTRRFGAAVRIEARSDVPR